MMADDMGWGDVGYHGHPVLKTPNLDAMAANGIRLDRFYSGAPVCSPTRGSCLTGRHPFRYGIFGANSGHMRPDEVTLAEALKTQGYATGHFGKWHLGTLTKTVTESNRGGPRGVAHFSPPGDNGFDVCFSTEAKVPTWDPMKHPDTGEPYGTYYWDQTGARVTDNLDGDDSRVIMDRVVPFVRDAARSGQPFFVVVWFHTPHLPVVAGPKYLKMYESEPEEKRHYYGALTAMDEQVGRVRDELRVLGVADTTMVWFCSDNGPEGRTAASPGSPGPFRGRKRSLFEGGVRVPGILEWPERVAPGEVTEVPCSTSDYFPTVMDALGFRMRGRPEPVDGISLVPLLEGRMNERPVPIAFESRGQVTLNDNRYKIVSQDNGKTYMLFDVVDDPGETTDLAAKHPDVAARMRRTVEDWQASCRRSLDGDDYS
ncbi:MAG: sulfatase-like hydrolase/transferase [bacterium]|nr:sulfatase-like hydrolase/transferase [bacterium]